MRTGRPTTERKGEKLILRLPEEMRVWVEAQSNRRGISMSEFLREMIRCEMHSGNLQFRKP